MLNLSLNGKKYYLYYFTFIIEVLFHFNSIFSVKIYCTKLLKYSNFNYKSKKIQKKKRKFKELNWNFKFGSFKHLYFKQNFTLHRIVKAFLCRYLRDHQNPSIQARVKNVLKVYYRILYFQLSSEVSTKRDSLYIWFHYE